MNTKKTYFILKIIMDKKLNLVYFFPCLAGKARDKQPPTKSKLMKITKYTDANGIEYLHTGKDEFGGIPHVSVSYYNPKMKEGGTGWIPTVLWIALTCPPVARPEVPVWVSQPLD